MHDDTDCGHHGTVFRSSCILKRLYLLNYLMLYIGVYNFFDFEKYVGKFVLKQLRPGIVAERLRDAL